MKASEQYSGSVILFVMLFKFNKNVQWYSHLVMLTTMLYKVGLYSERKMYDLA